MKKIMLTLAGLVLIATSCTKTEIVDNGEQTTSRNIGFSVYTARQTRAAQEDVTTSNLNTFQVSAIGNDAMYFNNVTFTKSTVWKSNPAYHWPAYPLTFCAYNVPANGTLTTNITKDAQTLTFSPSTNLAEQEDLVAAYAAGKKESDVEDPESSLPITFNHYLTQVVVKAKISNANYTVKVSGVKVANLAGEGTYTFNGNTMAANNTMINTATSSDYDEDFNEKILTNEAQEVMKDGVGGKWYLVPQSVTPWNQGTDKPNASNGTYLALKVKISTNGGAKIYPKTGDAAAWMAVPVPAELAFAKGKKYNVTIDFFSAGGVGGVGGAGYVDPENPSDLDGDGDLNDDKGLPIVGGAIKFNATVDNWGDVNVDINL